MRKRIQLSPFIKDIGLTTITSGLTIFSIIIATRLLAQGLGVEQFGAYSLARVVISILTPFTTLAMGIAITRYVALSKDDYNRFSYFFSGVLVVLTAGTIVFITGFIFRDRLAILIFHNKAYTSLFVATMFMLIGYAFYSVVYSLYRGLGEMKKANLWRLGVMAVGPIVVALVYANSGRVDLIVFLMGMISFTALFSLISYIHNGILKNKHIFKIKRHLKEVLRYSTPRVPGGFAFIGILAMGPFLAIHFGSLKGVGFLVAGQAIFRIIEAGVGAFGIVALPKIAQLLGDSNYEFLKDKIRDIIAFIFHLGLFVTLHLFLWADLIVLAWLGNQYVKVIYLVRIFSLALIPYLTFTMLSSIIDAVQEKAVNASNLYISFFVTLASSLFLAKMGLGVMGFAIGVTIGFTTLGLLTVRYLIKNFQLNNNALMAKKCLLINVVLIMSAFALRHWLEMIFSGLTLISIAAIVEGLFFLLYCTILWRMKVSWIIELRNRIISHKAVIEKANITNPA